MIGRASAITTDAQHKALAAIYGKAGDAAFAGRSTSRRRRDRYGDAADGSGRRSMRGCRNQYKAQQADALDGAGRVQKGDNDAFDQSLKLYDEVMTYLDGQPDDDAVGGRVDNEFGEALSIYGDRQQDERISRRRAACVRAGRSRSGRKDKKPVDWARTQNNLGNVYASLGDRRRTRSSGSRRRAAYDAALEVWTEDTQPDRLGAGAEQSRHRAAQPRQLRQGRRGS